MLHIPKKWRKLPLNKRLDLPVKYFKIDSKEVKRIRNIKNKREKLIESGKIQFKKFGEIHSFLIAWIAGYGSDSEVRNVFGSTNEFRRLFIKSPKNKWGLEVSWSDIKRGVKIPDISLELAEETGIHLGDGSLTNYHDKEGYLSFRYGITGDLRDEELYHETFIVPLLEKLYGTKPIILKRPLKNCIETKINSKAVIQFKHKILGLPLGSKKNAKIPEVILKDNELAKKCLVGIFDTDFSITDALSISGKLHSLELAEQIHLVLNRNGIDHVYRKYLDYSRFYIPKKSALIIAKEWGMHNPKHLSKLQVFERFKTFIPYSLTKERLDLLEGKISLEKLSRVCEKRRALIKNERPLLDSN